MRSDIVDIDNTGLGFQLALEQAKKVAVFKALGESEAVQLQILTEELLSLARSITGMVNASIWIEMEGDQADLHLTTEAILDIEKHAELIASSTSRKNAAANTVLGKLRNMLEEAMTADTVNNDPPIDVLNDLPNGIYEEPDWDGYERSILRRLADEIKVGIKGKEVDITVSKRFGTQE